MISGHLYIPRQGDRDFFIDYYNDFMKLSDIELENANVSAKKPILYDTERATNHRHFNNCYKRWKLNSV